MKDTFMLWYRQEAAIDYLRIQGCEHENLLLNIRILQSRRHDSVTNHLDREQLQTDDV